jgi:uncharacterized surface protein with fasciclin (FAS1) repeats
MRILFFLLSVLLVSACSSENPAETKTDEATPQIAGQSAVSDNVSQKDVVKIAAGSPDHTTLVKAIQAAGLVDALSNAGPFTVFAPTNAAFDQLPAGTLDDLMKPENKEKLIDILQYHVTTSSLGIDRLQDGQVLGEVNGTKAEVHVKDGKTMINDATILASIQGSNGMVHVIDKVLLPKQ